MCIYDGAVQTLTFAGDRRAWFQLVLLANDDDDTGVHIQLWTYICAIG